MVLTFTPIAWFEWGDEFLLLLELWMDVAIAIDDLMRLCSS